MHPDGRTGWLDPEGGRPLCPGSACLLHSVEGHVGRGARERGRERGREGEREGGKSIC